MATSARRALSHLQNMLVNGDVENLAERLQPGSSKRAKSVPGSTLTTPESIARRWELLPNDVQKETLIKGGSALDAVHYSRNIENYIGTVKVPVGIAGPLRVNGVFAAGDYFVPLATTEAALVASYTRGSRVITASGGCSTLILMEGVTRAPGFIYRNLQQAGQFVAWSLSQYEQFKAVAEATTRYGKLSDMRVLVEGNHVYLTFEFLTGDAAGQNMVTIATEGICNYIAQHSPIKPEAWFVESNLSGDKKASSQAFQSVRGKKVTAEINLTEDVLRKGLHTSADAMEEYWRLSALGGVLSGTIGVQGHYANGLAALFIATGQDAACVSEAAVGITRFEARRDGSLYAAVTLPNLIVGTVGGGTELPSQAACLDILGLRGDGKARALAEVAAALSLAGELSIIAALCCGQFARSHHKLARGKRVSARKSAE
jgi:hydroxymethylglutaryl-CoA reductase (NADPH)